MKKHLLFLAFCLVSTFSFSQTEKYLENTSSCDVQATMYYVKQGSCTIVGNKTYVASPGGSTHMVAPKEHEFVYAEVTFANCKKGNQIITVGCGTCNPGHPSMASAHLDCALTCLGLDVYYECGIHLTVH